MVEKRTNLFEVILYQDSLDKLDFNFIDYINSVKVPCILSPLHNLDYYTAVDERNAQKEIDDINSCSVLNDKQRQALKRLEGVKDGALKKPHYHLIVNYGPGANKTKEQCREDFVYPLNAKYNPHYVRTERGAVRYLIHMDAPAKAQYRLDELRVFSGYDVKDYYDLSNKEVDQLKLTILQLIEDLDIYDYFTLSQACSGYMPYFNWVASHTVFLNSYLKARSEQLWCKYDIDDLKNQTRARGEKFFEDLSKKG